MESVNILKPHITMRKNPLLSTLELLSCTPTTIDGVQYQGAISTRVDQVVPDEKPAKGECFNHIIPLVMLMLNSCT